MKSKVHYELYWRNGEAKRKGYVRVGGLYRTMHGVIRAIRASCNHSKGSGYRVYAITDGIKIEIDYRTYLNQNYAS